MVQWPRRPIPITSETVPGYYQQDHDGQACPQRRGRPIIEHDSRAASNSGAAARDWRGGVAVMSWGRPLSAWPLPQISRGGRGEGKGWSSGKGREGGVASPLLSQ
ncbi:hypothetical protein BaRGS_00035930 [Batillaria attramentaria]|uniref:Uncharacterized protein n=1 Tax=Batillaria attramentaria TaxID=370345 RepID=A0ABD0JD41_9CAEN